MKWLLALSIVGMFVVAPFSPWPKATLVGFWCATMFLSLVDFARYCRVRGWLW